VSVTGIHVLAELKYRKKSRRISVHLRLRV
jgi:hypothetical protein